MIHILTKSQCGLTDDEFNGFGMWIVDFVHKTIAPEKSNGAIRRDITGGAVRIDDVQITDDKARVKCDREANAWAVILAE